MLLCNCTEFTCSWLLSHPSSLVCLKKSMHWFHKHHPGCNWVLPSLVARQGLRQETVEPGERGKNWSNMSWGLILCRERRGCSCFSALHNAGGKELLLSCRGWISDVLLTGKLWFLSWELSSGVCCVPGAASRERGLELFGMDFFLQIHFPNGYVAVCPDC